jgi:triacylglycerol lipase
VAVSLPDDNTGDLWDSAWTLGQTARDVMDATGAGSVDVVGYSAGGVVARLWASTSGSGALHRVVTIGSPHHGSEGAEIFPECLTACEQLTPGSDFLEELSAVDETPGDAEWVSLWSETDGAVDPPDSSALEGALNLPLQAVCADADVDHGGLLSDPLAVNMVVAQLEAEEPTEFGPDDCGRFTAG